MKLSLLLLVVFLCSPAAHAYTITKTIKITTTADTKNIPGECSLRDAFANVNAGGIHSLANNSCTAAAKTISDEATLISLAGKTFTIAASNDPIRHIANHVVIRGGTLHGGEKSPIFTVQNDGTHLVLEDLWVRSGRSSGSGGCVQVTDNAAFTADGVSFFACDAAQDGGALLVQGGGFVHLTFVAFSENRADDFGGAMRVSGSEEVTIKNSKFVLNQAQIGGGAIYALNTPISAVDSIFDGNRTEQGGGGAIWTDDLLSIDRTRIEGNQTGDGPGAGLYLADSADATVLRSSLTRNSAGTESREPEESHGAAIFTNGKLELRESSLWENEASGSGAGIYVGDNTSLRGIALLNSSLIANVSSREGSALWITGASAPPIYDPKKTVFEVFGMSMLNLTIAENISSRGLGGQIHLDGEVGDNRNQQILFVNNIVSNSEQSSGSPCSGLASRLLTRLPGTLDPEVRNAQLPSDTCGTDIPVVDMGLINFGDGWYWEQRYVLPTLPRRGDQSVCTVVGNVDQFRRNRRTCTIGAAIGPPPIVNNPPTA